MTEPTTLTITYRRHDLALCTIRHTLPPGETLSSFLYSINHDRPLDLLASFLDPTTGRLTASIPARAILHIQDAAATSSAPACSPCCGTAPHPYLNCDQAQQAGR
jgi:hypothetical protein